MRFSVVMASYLGVYRTAATDRERKLIRAVNSVITQSFTDFELLVIADGCERTIKLMEDIDDTRVKVYWIERSKLFSGAPRNAGIEVATGKFIVYLDTDDMYGENHLKNINEGLKDYDWVWFDDIRYSSLTDEWFDNVCNIERSGRHGTSNICHKRELPYRWIRDGYAHDHFFISNLRQNTNFAKIPGGEYYVCHIPNSTIGKGYDK